MKTLMLILCLFISTTAIAQQPQVYMVYTRPQYNVEEVYIEPNYPSPIVFINPSPAVRDYVDKSYNIGRFTKYTRITEEPVVEW